MAQTSEQAMAAPVATPPNEDPMGLSRTQFWKAMGYGMIAAIIWSAWPVFSRLAVRDSVLTAQDITALRFLCAGLILLPYLWKKGLQGLPLHHAGILAFGAGIPYVLLAVGGLSLAPASHNVLLAPPTMLTITTLFGWLLLKDKPNTARLVGLALIMTGSACIAWESMQAINSDSLVGDLMFMAAGTCWAIYTLAVRAFKVDAWHATAIVSVFSMVLYLPYYLIMVDGNILDVPWYDSVIQALFQGLGTAVLALLFFTKAVALLGAGRGAVFTALIPAIAIIMAIPVLQEIPSRMELIGLCIVSAGMVAAFGLHRMLFSKREQL